MNGRVAVLLLVVLTAGPALAQPAGQCPGDLPAYLEGQSGNDCTSSSQPGCKIGCNFLNNCRTPTITGPSIEVEQQLDGTYTARLKASVHVPWNAWAGSNNPNGTAEAVWYGAGSIASCDQSATVSTCQHSTTDNFDTWIEFSGLTCDGTPYNLGSYSLRVKTCQQPCCGGPFGENCICSTDTWADREGLSFTLSAGALGCPQPPPEKCNGDASCTSCFGGGTGGAGGPPGWGGPGDGNSGPGAKLRYAGDGAGLTGLPGAEDWQETLGQGWSHDYAKRIVTIPGDTAVWLITEFATFRKFSDPDGLGIYQTAWPADEYRTLTAIGLGGSGWELRELDGTVHAFGPSGLWSSTTDRNGNAKTATYTGGKLTGVAFPDGRSETFTYFEAGTPSEGKLEEITEIGVDGSTMRTWSLTWSGNDLTRLERPDGTAFVFTYGDTRFPGYLTLQELEPDGGGASRVVRGWEYTEDGNVSRTWTGKTSPDDPEALDLWTFTWIDPQEPTVVAATDPFGQTTTYQIGRHVAGGKTRVTQISGDCPTCGLGPNTQLTYGDSSNPLRVTLETDGRGLETAYTYDAFGQMTSKVEAMGTPEERETTWEYDPDFPALVTLEEMPSVAGGAMFRTTEWVRDIDGNPETVRISGVENGSAFVFETETTFDATGVVETIDAPGHGTADLVAFAYDATRGGMLVSTRTDPLIGDTTFDYDPFNRRISETDPNGVERTTAFDDLDRVTEVREKGAIATDDLVTAYAYNAFGDLSQTTLPRGNVIAYGYDFAGRLVTVERKSDATTPGERTRWTLDEIGRRVREDREVWDAGAGAWVSVSATESEYLTRCHLDRRIEAPGTPEQAVTELAYDCNGNLAAEWDAHHEGAATPTRSFTYDALDRLTAVTSPWGGVGGGTTTTSYGYDVQDHLVSVTDGEGNVTAYSTSDRDLLTQEDSPASGVTDHTYTPSGELGTTTDARGIVTTYSHDALDRVTLIDLPGTEVDTSYVYDDPLVPFSKGRLTKITQGTAEVAYEYDRFGRMTQDGALGFGHDPNGNRSTMTYPGGVTATYGFDFADRPVTVSVTDSSSTTTSVVTDASYLPGGPLSGVTFGNGLVETRSFDGRYAPTSIALAGPTEGLWEYTTDAVGNILEIRETVGCSSAPLVLSGETVTTTEAVEHCSTIEAGDGYGVASPGDLTLRAQGAVVLSDGFSVGGGASFTAISESPPPQIVRTYAYQDVQYFLTQGNGPWGARSWSHDRIGNRLTETRDGLPADAYQYPQNSAGGNSPALSSIALGTGNTRDFTYGAAGHLESISLGSTGTGMGYDDAGRLVTLTNLFDSETVDLGYDGRGYLSAASSGVGGVSPVYSSDGLLHALVRSGETVAFLYLADRPVGRVTVDGAGAAIETYTTDHLGTPILVADEAGAQIWSGGFEPFGGDDTGSATAAGVELRFPGQVEDESWESVLTSSEMYYNVHRWYVSGLGRYTRPDPIGLPGGINLYSYVEQNPVMKMDPLGLASLGVGGRVINRTDCCVLVSENASTQGQQQLQVKPHSSSGSRDVDAIYFDDGSALKIPDGSIYVITDCDALSSLPTGFFSKPLLSYLRIPKYRTKPLPDRPAQEEEFGGPILPPAPTCECS